MSMFIMTFQYQADQEVKIVCKEYSIEYYGYDGSSMSREITFVNKSEIHDRISEEVIVFSAKEKEDIEKIMENKYHVAHVSGFDEVEWRRKIGSGIVEFKEINF